MPDNPVNAGMVFVRAATDLIELQKLKLICYGK